MRGEIFVDLGAYVRTNGLIAPRTLAQAFTGPYRVPNVRMTIDGAADQQDALRHLSRARPLRGVVLLRAADRTGGARSRDRQRRDAAAQPDRRRRKCRTGWPGWSRAGAAVDTECDSGDYREALDRCLAEFGWEEKRALQGREIDGRYHGVAVACFIEGSGAGPKETARLELEPDGTVSVYVGSTAVGQGLETVMAQIAADTLGLPLDQVRIFHGSTPFLDEGYGAFASRSTVLGGSAVFEGAKALLEKIRAAAAARLGVAAEQIELVDGRAQRRRRTLARLRRAGSGRAAGRRHLRQRQQADLHLRIGGGACGGRPGTGHVELLDCLVVEDVGRIVNPLTLHGQAIGGAVQGLGGAFLENLVYDDNGQLLAGNLADYLIPTAPDFPRIRAIALENHPSPSNPLGVKGAGEGAIIPMGGLMANAVASALASFGAMPNELPLSPARVWRMGQGQPLSGPE